MTIFPIIEGRHLLLAWARALIGKGGKTGDVDEFDHHRRQHVRQRYNDSSEGVVEEKRGTNGSVAPILIKRKERSQ